MDLLKHHEDIDASLIKSAPRGMRGAKSYDLSKTRPLKTTQSGLRGGWLKKNSTTHYIKADTGIIRVIVRYDDSRNATSVVTRFDGKNCHLEYCKSVSMSEAKKWVERKFNVETSTLVRRKQKQQREVKCAVENTSRIVLDCTVTVPYSEGEKLYDLISAVQSKFSKGKAELGINKVSVNGLTINKEKL